MLKFKASGLPGSCVYAPQVAMQYLQYLLGQRNFAEAAALCPELLKVCALAPPTVNLHMAAPATLHREVLSGGRIEWLACCHP